MGKLKESLKQETLSGAFSRAVFFMTLLVAAASLTTITLCTAVKNWLVPITDEVMLHIYTEEQGRMLESSLRMRANAEKFEVPAFYVANDGEAWQRYNPVITDYAIEPLASPGFLSPKRRLLYDAMSVCTILMPLLYAIAGILLCSRIFYQKRLAGPLAVLTEGAQKIADKDLDFAMTCRQPDELGQLCLSFEKMRAELLESQRAVWAVMEERRQLNASVAHDLRTPITIIEGYTEYLQRNLKNGRVDEAKLSSILDNLSASATRLERYVNCVRDIQSLDDLLPDKAEHKAGCLLSEIRENFTVLAKSEGKKFVLTAEVSDEEKLYLDRQLFFRILENTVSNALRYAQNEVAMDIVLIGMMLRITVHDDGAGFSEEALRLACTPFYKEAGSEHLGVGLSICRILCKKHAGTLTVGNAEAGGAKVVFEFQVKESKV